MKKLLMLNHSKCASGDTRDGKIYKIINDKIFVYDEDTEDSNDYEYTKENLIKYPKGTRWITIEDESSKDDFEVYEDEDRFIIFETDKELAHKLINIIDGLDKAIVNMVDLFMKE